MTGGDGLQLASVDELLTRLDELEQQLQSMNSELTNMHRLSVLGVLAAGIAHEINNLLTPVLSYAQLALARPDDEELRTKALERTSTGIESVSQVVHAILGLTRGNDEETTANVAAVLDESIRCLGRDPAKDSVQIVTDIQPETWVAINPVVLQQVLLNLVLNAIKALKGQRGTITIAADQSPAGTTTIIVADDGPGIPKDVLPTLFDSPSESPAGTRKRPRPRNTHHRNDNPGNDDPRNDAPRNDGPRNSGQDQLDSTGRRSPLQLVSDEHETATGTGLGLSICKQLLTNACGTIECTSAPNDGATFTITLPSSSQAVRKAG